MQENISEKWDIRFMQDARHKSTWSKDPSTKCGSVIVDSKKRIVGQGYNGYPRGIADDHTLHIREIKYKVVIHAEVNAILNSQRILDGCTLYVWPMPPCSACAGVIIQSGITRVVTVQPSEDMLSRWKDDIELTEKLFSAVGISLVYLPIDKL